jgi:hypothetical protein
MSDQISAKGVGLTAGLFITDLAQFWADRQNRIYALGLEKLSKEYSTAEQKADALYDILAGVLQGQQEMAGKLNELEDERTHTQTLSNGLFYQQGFSDAIRLILTSLITS